VVSCFDPVTIEIAAGFRLLSGFEFTQAFGLPVSNTIGVRTPIVLPAFGLLAGCSKIDQFSHSAPRW
jgi:hypothetical protein